MAEWPTSKPTWPVTVKQLDAFAAANPKPVPVPGQLVIEETTTISKAAWPEPKKVDVNAHLMQTVNANIAAREIEAKLAADGYKQTAYDEWVKTTPAVVDADGNGVMTGRVVRTNPFEPRGETAGEVQGDAGWTLKGTAEVWFPKNDGKSGDDVLDAINEAGLDIAFVQEARTLMPSAELAHTFTKEPEVQANATLWPNDRGNGSKYYCGYQNAMNYVLLCGPYDTYEEAQERYDVAWERFGKDVALSFSFPVAFRDKKYMTVLTQPFTAALRKGSYGRL